MSNSPTLATPGAMFADVPADVVGESFSAVCSSCRFCSPGGFIDWHYGKATRSADIHCGFFDRRVTPVAGCLKHVRAGGRLQPHPLEH